VFILQSDPNANHSRLVRNVLTKLTVCPLANLLVGLFADVDPVRQIPNVANDNRCRLSFDGEVYNSAANLVANVFDLAVGCTLDPILCPLQFLIASGTAFAATLQRGEFSQFFTSTLDGATQFPGAKNDRFLLIADCRWVNLAQVYSDYIVAWCGWCFDLVIYNNVPIVALGFVTKDQAHFKDRNACKFSGQNNLDWLQPPGSCQQSNAILDSNPGVFPDGCSVEFSPPRIPSVLAARFFQGFDSLARLVERFLRSVTAMRVQGCIGKQIVVQFHGIELRKPDAVLAPDTPVYSHRLCVDSPTVQVAFIQQGLRLFGTKGMSEDHSTFSCSAIRRIAISIIAAWDTPNLFASSLSKRIASGVKRRLVFDLFFIRQLYIMLAYSASNGSHNVKELAKAKSKNTPFRTVKTAGVCSGFKSYHLSDFFCKYTRS
jgi:hypothetical protein